MTQIIKFSGYIRPVGLFGKILCFLDNAAIIVNRFFRSRAGSLLLKPGSELSYIANTNSFFKFGVKGSQLVRIRIGVLKHLIYLCLKGIESISEFSHFLLNPILCDFAELLLITLGPLFQKQFILFR